MLRKLYQKVFSRLFNKVLVYQAIVFGLTAAAISFEHGYSIHTNLTHEFESKGTAIARSISFSAVDMMVNRDLSTIQAVINQYREISGVAYVLVTDASGDIISHTFIPSTPEPVAQLVSTHHTSNQDSIDELKIAQTGDVIDIATPILAGLAGSVHVGMDRSIITSEIWSAVINQQLTMLGLFVLNILVAFLFVEKISAPMNALTAHARKIAGSDFSSDLLSGFELENVARRSKDEIGELATSFRQMERKLKDYTTQLEDYNQKLEQKVEERTRELRDKNGELEQALGQLRTAQDQIVMQQKLASLGSLTAGIAHEIKNPLNFVNNFSDLSAGLVDELRAEIDKQKDKLPGSDAQYIGEILDDLKLNAKKITEHGKRADSIVRNMLLHSRASSGQAAKTNLNSLFDEYAGLAYHGIRGTNPDFNVRLVKDLDPTLPDVTVVPQDIGRVFLNLINNACYAAFQKNGAGATVTLSTRNLGDRVEIRVRDNGPGIPPEVREKLFHPFFTTKPAGEGTGLGLSISYEIVVVGHKGELRVESEPGSHAEFIVTLPVKE
jgi:signal transduction histidine kinase